MRQSPLEAGSARRRGAPCRARLDVTSPFKRDKKRVTRSGRRDWAKMLEVVQALMSDLPLPVKHRDHELAGEYAGVRERHVEPEWLLMTTSLGPSPAAR